MSKRKDYLAALALMSPALISIVFATLRLCGIVSWSWWLVTSPLWIVAALAILIGCIVWIVVSYKIRLLKR